MCAHSNCQVSEYFWCRDSKNTPRQTGETAAPRRADVCLDWKPLITERKMWMRQMSTIDRPWVRGMSVCVCDCVRVWRNSVEISNYQGGVGKGLSALEYADWAEGKNISEMVRFVCAPCCMWVVICSELCNTYAIENKALELRPSGQMEHMWEKWVRIWLFLLIIFIAVITN